MRFNFTEDQTMFGQSLGSFLENEYTAEFARSLWDTDTGRSDKLWTALAWWFRPSTGGSGCRWSRWPFC